MRTGSWAGHLVVRGSQDPRVLVMEESGPNVVQVTEQVEQTALGLVVPDLR